MAKHIASPYDHGYHSIVIEGPRFSPINIENIVFELNLYESLSSPYLSGDILIIDSANLSNHVNFMGQEKITIKLFDTAENIFFSKTFVTTSVKKHIKSNDSTAGVVLSFVEEHVSLSNITRFSKTYEGKIENIISKILNEQLGVKTHVDASTQSTIRYIAPYNASPLKTVSMLRRRATNSSGSPFFLFASTKQPGLRLASLETLMSQQAFNKKPFVYSVVNDTYYSDHAYSVERFEDRSFKIRSFSMNENENIVELFKEAGFGAQYLWVDTNEDIATELRYRSPDKIKALPQLNGSINYDETFAIGGKQYHEGVSNYVSQITTKNLFDNINSLNEETTINNHMRKAEERSLRIMLSKLNIDVQLPGYQFVENEVIGKIIEIEIPKDIPVLDEKVTSEDVIDKKLSGNYLVFAARHLFVDDQYSVILNLTKVDNKRSLDNEQAGVV